MLTIEECEKSLINSFKECERISEYNQEKVLNAFKKNNVDIWNLSKEGNVVNLSNPFSGANASITLIYANQNVIKFTKKDNFNGKVLTDTVELNLNNDKFSGINIILLETLSDIDNSVIKSETATYSLEGERIAGEAIIKENK